jgi:hypothetical protein
MPSASTSIRPANHVVLRICELHPCIATQSQMRTHWYSFSTSATAVTNVTSVSWLTSRRRCAPGKVCHVAASANRLDVGGFGRCYRTLRCDRHRATGVGRALHRCRRGGPAAGPRGSRPCAAAHDRRPTGRAPARLLEHAGSTTTNRTDTASPPQCAYPGPGAEAGRSCAPARSPSAARPTTVGRPTDPRSSPRCGTCTAAGRSARNIARRMGDRT